jgi:Flp pilus assembly protein TadG
MLTLVVRWVKEELGQSIVEVALVLPMLVYLVVGGADVARAFAIQLAIQNGARAGAEGSALDYSPTVAQAQNHAIQEMNRTPGMTANNAVITMTKKQVDGTTDCPLTPSNATPCYFTVRVTYLYNTIIPWPLIPNQFQFDRSTMVRGFN